MLFEEYAERFLAHARVSRRVAPSPTSTKGGRRYPLLRAPHPGARTLLITAGFHGNETAGPLTLLEHFPEIVRLRADARRRPAGLSLPQPLGLRGLHPLQPQPGGAQQRFAALRADPRGLGGRADRRPALPRPGCTREGPKETRALAAELETLPTPDAPWTSTRTLTCPDPLSYAYSFGDNALPADAGRRPSELLPVARSYQVDDDVFTDDDGLIKLHDGSVTDYFHRRGVPYTVALETTTATPLGPATRST